MLALRQQRSAASFLLLPELRGGGGEVLLQENQSTDLKHRNHHPGQQLQVLLDPDVSRSIHLGGHLDGLRSRGELFRIRRL